MAIVKFVNVKVGNLKRAVNYITNENKTRDELIYCKDCNRNTVIENFEYVKKLYNNEKGRQYYHFIQSFSPDDKLNYRLANDIGKSVCEHFTDYQIIMTTHIDKDYIHNHFIMNSVNQKTGKKYQLSPKELYEIKKLSNELCKKYNLKQIDLSKDKYSRYIKSGEYHLSRKEETIKSKLIKTINKCVKFSKSKEQFIFKMNNLGYKVKWQDNRKYITYTTPENLKFRDKRLGSEKYSKVRMEQYFEKVSSINRVKNIVEIAASLKHKKNNLKNRKEKTLDDLSDFAKKDYITKNENSSTIEWE